jgi:membrane-associated phospholipid phosphatase
VVALVAGFAVILGCAIAAGELLRLLERPHGATGVDASITSWMVAHRASALMTLARGLSTVGSQVLLTPLTALAAGVLLWRRRFVLAGLLVVTWGGAILLYSLTKDVVDRMRPPKAIWLTDVRRSSSFPSGHAVQSLATFLALALVAGVWWPRAGWPARIVAIVLAAGVGWSRVYLGVHWATDVAAGWLIAAAWVAFVVWLVGLAGSTRSGSRARPAARQPPAAPPPQ